MLVVEQVADRIIPDIDIAQVRADTPSVAYTIHFDNAGASPTPAPVHDRIVRHLEREREIGGYSAAREVEQEVEDFYTSAAALIGAEADEIAFAENATRAWDMLFYAIPFAPGDRILTSRSDYLSNSLAFMQVAKRTGADIEYVPDGADGAIDPEALGQMLDDRVKLVSLCHVPTSNGLLNDAQRVGEVLRDHPALFLLDACQSVGQLDIDVAEIGCDMLSATGRKFLRGPRGTGFLYASRRILDRLDPPFVDMRAALWTTHDTFRFRDDARRFESWESPVAGRLGLGAAIEYASALGLAKIERRVGQLAQRLRNDLGQIPDVALLDRGTERSGLVTFRVDGWDAVALRDRLARTQISVTAIEVSDAPLDLIGHPGEAIVRASVHYYNVEEEIVRFVARIDALARDVR